MTPRRAAPAQALADGVGLARALCRVAALRRPAASLGEEAVAVASEKTVANASEAGAAVGGRFGDDSLASVLRSFRRDMAVRAGRKASASRQVGAPL